MKFIQKKHIRRSIITLAVASSVMSSFALSSSKLKNWGLETSSSANISINQAWKYEKGQKNVVVAVIDTGIDVDHPDLKKNIWKDAKTGIYGWDFTKNQANPKDTHGHGTHVAGIIGALLNPSSGTSGVVQNVSLMAVKYYNPSASESENLKNSIKALNWAIDHGARIINYSGGGNGFSMDEYLALRKAQEKNILVVAAAGNEGSDGDRPDNYYYPCAYKLDNIVCVAAVNQKNELISSSNWGKASVDVAAPGEAIISTTPKGQYSYMTGTSQGTAFVSGVAALLLSKNKNLTAKALKTILRSSVDTFDNLKSKVFSGGRINAAKALLVLQKYSEIVAVKASSKKIKTLQ